MPQRAQMAQPTRPSRERARCVPDQAVTRGLSRPLADGRHTFPPGWVAAGARREVAVHMRRQPRLSVRCQRVAPPPALPKRRSAGCPGHRADVDDRWDIGPGGAVAGHGVWYHELQATVGRLDWTGAGERVRTAGLPFTRSMARCAVCASCTDSAAHSPADPHRTGMIRQAVPRPVPRRKQSIAPMREALPVGVGHCSHLTAQCRGVYRRVSLASAGHCVTLYRPRPPRPD